MHRQGPKRKRRPPPHGVLYLRVPDSVKAQLRHAMDTNARGLKQYQVALAALRLGLRQVPQLQRWQLGEISKFGEILK